MTPQKAPTRGTTSPLRRRRSSFGFTVAPHPLLQLGSEVADETLQGAKEMG